MPNLPERRTSRGDALGALAGRKLWLWAAGICLLLLLTPGSADAARCRIMPAETLVSGMDAVFLGVSVGRGRFRVVEAYRGVRVGQIVRITGHSDWDRNERVYFAVKRVRPGTFFAPAAKDAGNVLCRSRSLAQQTDTLKRLRKRGR